MPENSMTIEILENGDLKVTTDHFGPAVHMQAEQLMSFIAKMAGGEVTRTKRIDVHRHVHAHDHEHHHH